MLKARTQVAEIRNELDELADRVGAGQVSAALAARAEPAILARLKSAEELVAELTTPAPLRDLIGPGVDPVGRWMSAPMPARREVLRLLFSPQVCGQLRVRRSSTPGHHCPVADRVWWKKLD